jgi:hypothetical protein
MASSGLWQARDFGSNFFKTLLYMKQIVFVIFLLCIAYPLFAQKESTDSPCRKNWRYLKTEKVIKGELMYFLPVSGCGYFTSATLAIVKTENGDLIRVLQVCDTTQKILPNTKVSLLPNTKEKDFASLLPLDKMNDCKITSTYYGWLKFQ